MFACCASSPRNEAKPADEVPGAASHAAAPIDDGQPAHAPRSKPTWAGRRATAAVAAAAHAQISVPAADGPLVAMLAGEVLRQPDGMASLHSMLVYCPRLRPLLGDRQLLAFVRGRPDSFALHANTAGDNFRLALTSAAAAAAAAAGAVAGGGEASAEVVRGARRELRKAVELVLVERGQMELGWLLKRKRLRRRLHRCLATHAVIVLPPAAAAQPSAATEAEEKAASYRTDAVMSLACLVGAKHLPRRSRVATQSPNRRADHGADSACALLFTAVQVALLQFILELPEVVSVP